MTHAEARKKWQATIDRYEQIDAPATRFNAELVRALRPNWEHRVYPATSMFTLLFTRHASNAFEGDERVKVDWESDGRVSVSLERTAPRRGESRPAGLVVVAGDIVRPENAARVVESFLMQVAGAETLQQRINRGLWRRQS